MELWIRTSDKLCLTKVHHLYVDSCNNIRQENDLILATYKTKERALQVLDEIQNILQPKPLVIVKPSEEMVELLGARQIGKVKKMEENIEYKEILTYVYQMPEE